MHKNDYRSFFGLNTIPLAISYQFEKFAVKETIKSFKDLESLTTIYLILIAITFL